MALKVRSRCCARDQFLVARAHKRWWSSSPLPFDLHRRCFNCRCRGFAPAPPQPPAALPLASCQRLPSGRHRTGKLDGASAWGACRLTDGVQRKHRSTDQNGSCVFRRGAASRNVGGICRTEARGAGAEPLRLQLESKMCDRRDQRREKSGSPMRPCGGISK